MEVSSEWWQQAGLEVAVVETERQAVFKQDTVVSSARKMEEKEIVIIKCKVVHEREEQTPKVTNCQFMKNIPQRTVSSSPSPFCFLSEVKRLHPGPLKAQMLKSDERLPLLEGEMGRFCSLGPIFPVRQMYFLFAHTTYSRASSPSFLSCNLSLAPAAECPSLCPPFSFTCEARKSEPRRGQRPRVPNHASGTPSQGGRRPNTGKRGFTS